MNDTCPSFEGCKAPLCPMDNSFDKAIWYPDEDICMAYQFRRLHWRKIQAKIKKINNIKPVVGYFSLPMLNAIIRVKKAIAGSQAD